MRRVLSIVALGAIVFLVGITAYRLYHQVPSEVPHSQALPTIELRGQTIRVSIADTEGARAQGLSGRAGLAADEGMLFVFPNDGRHGFWMKDMRFAIDILWLSADGRIVYMAQNVSPETYPQTFQPDQLARYVLELPAGYVKEYNVKVGDLMGF